MKTKVHKNIEGSMLSMALKIKTFDTIYSTFRDVAGVQKL